MMSSGKKWKSTPRDNMRVSAIIVITAGLNRLNVCNLRYFYHHKSSADAWPTWTGSKHGDEIEMTFGVPLQNPRNYKSNEIKFSQDIITYWLNFIQNG